jgi:hypothetical protein
MPRFISKIPPSRKKAGVVVIIYDEVTLENAGIGFLGFRFAAKTNILKGFL